MINKYTVLDSVVDSDHKLHLYLIILYSNNYNVHDLNYKLYLYLIILYSSNYNVHDLEYKLYLYLITLYIVLCSTTIDLEYKLHLQLSSIVRFSTLYITACVIIINHTY